MRKALAAPGLLILLLALLCLSGCGGSAEGVGRYECVALLGGEAPLTTPDSALLLDRGGYARFELDGQGGAAGWTLSGESLRLSIDGQVYEGTLRDGFVRIVLEDGITAVYAREDLAEDYRASLALEREHRAALQNDWTGDWYGLWRIENAEGLLADSWFDCCARLTATPDGCVTLLFWDEDSAAAKPLASLKLLPEDGGTARSTEGWFWFQSGQHAALTFRLADGVLVSEGVHEADGERFSYSLCLRRWGERWPEEAERPYTYDDWYLPLIRAGEAMPERISLNQ